MAIVAGRSSIKLNAACGVNILSFCGGRSRHLLTKPSRRDVRTLLIQLDLGRLSLYGRLPTTVAGMNISKNRASSSVPGLVHWTASWRVIVRWRRRAMPTWLPLGRLARLTWGSRGRNVLAQLALTLATSGSVDQLHSSSRLTQLLLQQLTRGRVTPRIGLATRCAWRFSLVSARAKAFIVLRMLSTAISATSALGLTRR